MSNTTKTSYDADQLETDFIQVSEAFRDAKGALVKVMQQEYPAEAREIEKTTEAYIRAARIKHYEMLNQAANSSSPNAQIEQVAINIESLGEKSELLTTALYDFISVDVPTNISPANRDQEVKKIVSTIRTLNATSHLNEKLQPIMSGSDFRRLEDGFIQARNNYCTDQNTIITSLQRFGESEKAELFAQASDKFLSVAGSKHITDMTYLKATKRGSEGIVENTKDINDSTDVMKSYIKLLETLSPDNQHPISDEERNKILASSEEITGKLDKQADQIKLNRTSGKFHSR